MDMAGEKTEPSFYQRIPQLLGKTAIRILLNNVETEESSDQSHIL